MPLATPSAPDRQLGIPRYFELSLFGLVVTAFAALAATGKLDVISFAGVFLALGARALLLLMRSSFNLAETASNQLTLAYVVFYPLDLFLFSRNFVTATVHLILFILVVKLFAVHRERDYIYQAVIAFMMLLAAAILTVDAVFLLAFCLFILLTVTTFISMEMRRSMLAADAASERAIAEPPRLAHSGREAAAIFTRYLNASALGILVGIVVLGTLIFFILPRVSSSYLTSLAAGTDFASGFSEEVSLGAIGRIQQSDSVVMHIQFSSADVPADLKLRGVALSYFDGRTWTRDRQVDGVSRGSLIGPIRPNMDGSYNLSTPPMVQRMMGSANALELRRAKSQTERLGYRVMLEPIGTNLFFLAPFPLSLTTDINQIATDESGNIFSADSRRPVRIYSGWSELHYPGPAARDERSQAYPGWVAKDYTELPEFLDTRIPALARRITRDLPTVYDRATAIETYLKTRYGYTLQLDPGHGSDPLAYFLFERRRGHCEYFASAMAVMLRSIGIPSRVVNGFRLGEYNDVTGNWIVRARQAHSWVEAYIPDYGWTTFDPTPASDDVPSGPWSRLALYVDALREFWGEWVVNYDFAHQNALSIRTVSTLQMKVQGLRRWSRRLYFEMLSRLNQTKQQPTRYAWRLLITVLVLLLLVNARRIWRNLRSLSFARRPGSAPRQAASIWYERLLKLLRRRGVKQTPSQTPKDLITAVDEPLLREDVVRFVRHYERARFGESADDAQKLPKIYEEIAKR